jgi:prepilin-type N-terminal cleavage/methylation domain-containing protein/prepilin-type processing-associated H-X9-DG protein
MAPTDRAACHAFAPGHTRQGFTLMELLVVVAVLVILASILSPALTQARARARQATCSSNLRQIAQAGLIYCSDYDDQFPSCYLIATPPFAIDPPVLLRPYLRSWQVFYCPERHTVMPDCLDPKNGFRPNARCMGYGYNWGSDVVWNAQAAKADGLVRIPPGRVPAVYGLSLSEVAVPGHCFFFGDTNDFFFLTLLRGTMPGVRKEGDWQPPLNDLDMAYEPTRHGGGNHFAFVDGHVQWLPFPGGRLEDGGPRVVPEMNMYSRTGRWEIGPVP